MSGPGVCLLCLVAIALPAAGVVLLVSLVRGTTRQTRLGVNLEVANACLACEAALPAVRAPRSVRQLW
ncbi:MAG: hypothetical protein INH41_01830 [Myxococcaceae bacterium]|jgi:hypothetical protein|nr:hypothetical protein [Myxococcaceae bacterium]MCA3011118.1 hypothetical protein [Myxococcaceae bacterium]